MKVNGTKFDIGIDQFILLQDNEWLEKQRIAGTVVAGALSLLENLVKEKTTKSLLELDKIAEGYIRDNGCIPTFLNYKGFPNSVCVSINKQLVHGIPTDYRLFDNDIVSFDLGATEPISGAIADSAITCIFGKPKNKDHMRLVQATKYALSKAIASIKIGKQLGIIGATISKLARQNNFSVVSKFGGHGIQSHIPHAPPFVSNKDVENNGVRFAAGMVLAIEPLFVLGNSNNTRISNDGWTVICDDICAHEEHTIYIHQDWVEIITERANNENKT